MVKTATTKAAVTATAANFAMVATVIAIRGGKTKL